MNEFNNSVFREYSFIRVYIGAVSFEFGLIAFILT